MPRSLDVLMPDAVSAAVISARTPAWLWPVATLVTAGLGALATSGAPAFYAALDRPAWAPPAWVFGPVWSCLYALMALAAYHVARSGHHLRSASLAVFGLQLVANLAWSWLFFHVHRGGWALADLVVLLVLLIGSALSFGRVKAWAGWMLVPSLLWVSFAGLLNVSVWMRNPALLGG